MAGYSRQSAASIVPTAVVRATPLNDEFNALRDAFVVATGHKHDGTSTEGAYIPLVSDTNARNKVVVDSANNRISLFINVSSAAVEQLRLIDGAILPVTDNDIDLGSSSFEFKDLFIDGTANIDSLVADTAAISGGTINSAVIGGTTPAAGTFTTITATVSATIPSVAITGGTINNTIIGATTPAAGTFTNLTVNTAATIASAAISAGTINNTVIGGTTPQAVTGTTITANTGFVGALTGNVTGNVTASSGTSTFNNATVNGTLSATLTGNVNASSGTSTFNNVTISGTLNMDGATAATITNLSSPVNNSDAATKLYVDTSISNLVNSAPGTLDTLNELASALGNDPSFATTVTNSIATKLSLSGGTMTGAIAMGTNKITGMGDPTSAQDAATKTYVDTQRDTRLALSGGTMTGNIVMGANKITSTATPTTNDDLTRKGYVDSILGSATSAAASAAAAATSASNAATSASNASTSETNAAASASAAAASYDSFDDRYLGAKSSDPTLDNDGNALLTGALYWNTTAGEMRVYSGTAWVPSYLTTGAQTFTGVKTFASNPILNAGTANGVAYLDGSKVLTTGSALTFDGTNIDLATVGAKVNFATTGSATRNYVGVSADGYSLEMVMQRGASQPLSYKQNFSVGHEWGIAGSGAMTLTSTGLGIGTSSPAEKLQVAGTIRFGANATYYGTISHDAASTGSNIYNHTDSGGHLFQVGGSTLMNLNASGNLGLGVTPSAWVSTFKAIQVGNGASFQGQTNSVSVVHVSGNAYVDSGGTYRYIGTGEAAQRYQQYLGAHSWYTAPSGTAGNAISFTQAMTLDASGNLGVITTSPTSFLSNWNGLAVGTTSGSNGIAIVSGTASPGTLAFADGTSGADQYRGYIQYNHSSNSLLFGTDATERARITSGGNLGLGFGGAFSALANLDILTGGQGGGIQLVRNASGNPTSGQSLGSFAWKGIDSANTNAAAEAMIEAVAAENQTGSTAATNMLFYTKPSGTGPGSAPTERFRIASNGAWGLAGANYGTSGQVLTSNGSGSAPTWQNAGGGGSAATPTALGTVYGLTQDASGTANTVLGYQGLNANTTGNSNVSAGVRALYTNTTGSRLTALGYSALYNSTTSSDNTAVGSLSMLSNTTGAYNTAVGSDALRLNTTASYNTANGYQALYSNTTAQSNSAVGSFALYGATTGGSNTAVGYNAGAGITTGVENTFLGNQAGGSGNGSGIIGIGYNAGRGGGSNSVWIGYNAGQSTSNSGIYNVGMGFYAGVSNTSGQSNVFLGYQAGQANTTGSNNVFIGGEAGNGTGAGHANTTGSTNVAVGASALKSNTTGGKNTAVGYQALYSAATTRFTAIGYQALYSWNGTLTTDAWNTAVGENVLRSATTGICNVAVGCSYYGDNTSALHDLTTGNYCTAMGAGTMKSVTTGSGNTGFGYNTTYYLTTGNYNTSVGYAAGSGWGGTYLTTGSGNTYVGFGSNPSSSSVQSELMVCSSSTYALNGKGSNTGFIAAYNGSYGGIYQGNNSSSWSTTSDRRLKKNIVDNNEGIEVISQIRVRNFEYRLPEEVDPELSPKTAVDIKGVQLGVIAQELQQVCPDCVKEESTGVLSVDSDNVFWHMVNAIKQLKTELDTVKAELATLKGA